MPEKRRRQSSRPKKRVRRFNNHPTVYQGIRFRSKLESYVAKAFDRAQVKWVFEPRVRLEGRRYCLPDFYLPDYDAFIEVRPSAMVDQKLLEKMVDIHEQYDKKVYLVHHQSEIPKLVLLLKDRRRKHDLSSSPLPSSHLIQEKDSV